MQKEEKFVSGVLAKLDIDSLNAMQEASLQAYKEPNDLLILSATGTGKTLAYLLPLVAALDTTNAQTQAMVVLPSRELAQQTEQVFRSMSSGFKVTCCYGGHLRETEENNLLEAPAVVIGTPGRLADHLRRGNIKTGQLTTLVVDEFDKTLELGFQEELGFIVSSLTALNKRVLLSATAAIEVPDFVRLNQVITLDFLPDGPPKALAIQIVQSDLKDKLDSLFAFLCLANNRSAIVFCNHRESVERVSEFLSDKGIVNVFYHGAMEQRERDTALGKFRNGTSTVLVTTDLAARGLDIPNIRYIVHYHLPLTEDAFVHRNGRTARMDASGTVVLLVGPEEQLPDFVPATRETIQLPLPPQVPVKPKWCTVFIGAGKKDKINKVDIVGFFTNKGQLKKEDIGLIEVKDFQSFVAIRRSSVGFALQNIKNEKIKNKKVKIDIAR